MLDTIRRFFRGLEPSVSGAARIDDPRVAAAALLVHVSHADGDFTETEALRLRAFMRSEFGLDEEEAARLVEEGRRADAEAVDLYRFTSVLLAGMDEAQRVDFVDAIWDMIYADGGVHELEDNLAWRIAELLGVSTRDRMIGKRQAAERSEPGS